MAANCSGVKRIIFVPFFSPSPDCILVAVAVRFVWGITYGALITTGLDWIFWRFEDFELLRVIILTGWFICLPPLLVITLAAELTFDAAAEEVKVWTDILFNASFPASVNFNVWLLDIPIFPSSSGRYVMPWAANNFTASSEISYRKIREEPE